MQKWFIDVLRNKYADFSGRASRQEYWMFALCNYTIFIILFLINSGLIINLVSIALIIPYLAISVRRFHDLDKSGWWLLLLLTPLLIVIVAFWLFWIPILGTILQYIGLIIVMIFFAKKGTPGPNRYGADPLVDNVSLPPPPPPEPAQM